uniref:G-protein coupled receptors family 2 profile 2 domain-containing protein n=1 Tax=Calidris pygmaea TaxID=425635 RepID=A0A8C3JV47_9CHAR
MPAFSVPWRGWLLRPSTFSSSSSRSTTSTSGTTSSSSASSLGVSGAPAWPCLLVAWLPWHSPTQPLPVPTGLPTLAVVAVFVFKRDTYGYHTISTSEGYRNATMCWLTSPPAHYATVCYAGLILLFNTLVLGRVGMILRRIHQQNGQARKDWATVLGLTCLLGTTWGLGFFSFGVFLIPQLYLFTILNSLQGFFVCVWYITVHCRSKLGSISNTSRQRAPMPE